VNDMLGEILSISQQQMVRVQFLMHALYPMGADLQAPARYDLLVGDRVETSYSGALHYYDALSQDIRNTRNGVSET
jgi:hypothetical protein